MAIPSKPARGRKPIRRGPGKRIVEGNEVRYIQRRAAEYDGRIVTIGQLVLFSTETGDARVGPMLPALLRPAAAFSGAGADQIASYVR